MDDLVVKKGASVSPDPAQAVRELHEAIYSPSARLTIIYCAPTYDLDALGREIREQFGDTQVIGATTAGEITPIGYLEGALTGVSIEGPGLHAESVRIDGLKDFTVADGDAAAREAIARLDDVDESGGEAFGFLLVDGMSMQEEMIVSAIYRNLGETPLFGGSAADGTDFGETAIYYDGAFRGDCAVFTLVRSSYPFLVFKTEHFVPTDQKMVVTGAIPEERTVTEINGVPAGREYARAVGLDVDELSQLIFAAHPVVVNLGGETFVRSIMKVNDDESLSFACAIDTGIVLTVARGVDMVSNLEAAFSDVEEALGKPALILGCDCLFRNLEAQQRDLIPQISELMVDNNVVGFATYGEQFNGMHVNQTFTGVALSSSLVAA